jgi:methylthioxylose transferase
MLSYGLLLLGILALTVLVLGRSWLPLPVAAVAALTVIALFAALGFSYLDALPALHDRYLDGVGGRRPARYSPSSTSSTLAGEAQGARGTRAS